LGRLRFVFSRRGFARERDLSRDGQRSGLMARWGGGQKDVIATRLYRAVLRQAQV